MAEFFTNPAFSKLDVLVNCPSTTIKRAAGAFPHIERKNLLENLLAIEKDYWYVREPYHKMQWTFLIGTNWDQFPLFSEIGFYRATSPEGREVLAHLAYTAEELRDFGLNGFYREYPEFLAHPFTRMMFREVKARAKRKCMKCGFNVSDVHHLNYPEWKHKNSVVLGFDTEENLIALCRRCHCEAEGKER